MSINKSHKETELLKNWYKTQQISKSYKELATKTNIPYSALKHYFAGRSIKNKNHRRALYEATGIELLKEKELDIPSMIKEEAVQYKAKKEEVSETLKHQLTITLRQWFQSQTQWKSLKELAKATAINYSTLKHYFEGHNFPTEENLKKLIGIIKIPALSELIKKEPQLSRAETITSQEILSFNYQDAAQKAQKVYDLLLKLNDELEFFKKGTPKDRELFRNTIPGKDIGYIIALLKALYDEDAFQNWLFFAEYKMRR
ncbi:MAG: hypothetical protein HZA07_03595 [Nitrospirae bacterium]|nr:hypothetical protein [Nitrospirota bacterium]